MIQKVLLTYILHAKPALFSVVVYVPHYCSLLVLSVHLLTTFHFQGDPWLCYDRLGGGQDPDKAGLLQALLNHGPHVLEFIFRRRR